MVLTQCVFASGHTPENVPESGGYCSLERTIAMAKKIKQEGFDFLLDFHYSDWWADPGKQRKPMAWENLHGTELEEAVYTYTKKVLCALKEAGAMPDMVQIWKCDSKRSSFPRWRTAGLCINGTFSECRESGRPEKLEAKSFLL